MICEHYYTLWYAGLCKSLIWIFKNISQSDRFCFHLIHFHWIDLFRPPPAIQTQRSNKVVPLVIDSEDAYVLIIDPYIRYL